MTVMQQKAIDFHADQSVDAVKSLQDFLVRLKNDETVSGRPLDIRTISVKSIPVSRLDNNLKPPF